MFEAEALLAAIRQAPDDDAPRLIYADWLDEHGQPERAEFIRVQVELARNDSLSLEKRESDLLAEHYSTFVGSFNLPGIRYSFSRGFISGFGHSGCFASVDEDGVSMFRFYPDQVFISRYSVEPLEQAVRELYRNHPYVLPGTYRLSSIENPVEFEIQYRAPFGGKNRESVCLKVGRLSLTVNEAPERIDYQLIDFDGVDSFTGN
jgi:uncharacterized protein (TIGR02996 family)